MCLQNLAKQQLFDLEKVRNNENESKRLTNGNVPNYENVEQVQDDVASLMSRMKAMTNFIQNQSDLSALLGEDGEDILAEQVIILFLNLLNSLLNLKISFSFSYFFKKNYLN